MKKKIVSLCLVVCLLATAVIGGTLAYFTDTDSAKNVMTSGNVSITQNEKQRDVVDGQPVENATELEDFEDGKALLPAVFYDEDTKKPLPADKKLLGEADVPTWGLVAIEEVNGDESYSKNLLDKSITNEVDKIVSVTNDGSLPVYVRTIFLMENKVVDANKDYEDGKYLGDYVMEMWTENGGQNSGNYNRILENGEPVLVDIGGTSYSIQVHYYENVLEPGKTTAASLKQFYLDPNATNDFYTNLGADGQYTILALSQAVQTEGFTDDRAALDTAFGEVDATNVKDWFANVK